MKVEASAEKKPDPVNQTVSTQCKIQIYYSAKVLGKYRNCNKHSVY